MAILVMSPVLPRWLNSDSLFSLLDIQFFKAVIPFIVYPSFISRLIFLYNILFKLICWLLWIYLFSLSFFLQATLIFPRFYLSGLDILHIYMYVFKILSFAIQLYFSLGQSYISFPLWEHTECFVFVVWKRRSIRGLQDSRGPEALWNFTQNLYMFICGKKKKTSIFKNSQRV